MKLSNGDTVIVISGKDKGKKGTVLRVIRSQNRVIVGGINMVTKHVKKTAQAAGQKLKYESSIHASNVMAIDPKSGKPTRVGYKMEGKKKVRIAKKSGVELTRTKVQAEKKPSAPGVEASSKKSPFWKKGSQAADAAAGGSASKSVEEPAHPSALTSHRSAGRGS